MNADRLLALYEKVSDAPDTIARLRRFVLGLAVRGKLVAQEPGGEPASELLKRIAAEKARLVKAGKSRSRATWQTGRILNHHSIFPRCGDGAASIPLARSSAAERLRRATQRTSQSLATASNGLPRLTLAATATSTSNGARVI